jgi:hypothetical protein
MRPLKVLALVFAITVVASAFSSGPPDEKTGAPGEGTCNDCHSGSGGTTTITAPGSYSIGDTYTITVEVADGSASRWGFEVVALDSNGDQAGTITITDSTNTQSSETAGKTYVKHTSTGTYAGTPNSGSWSFDWTPNAAYGDVTFYAAGNAANNNGANTGDKISTTSETVPHNSAVEGSSLGVLKAEFK